jgi:hypothetical protein
MPELEILAHRCGRTAKPPKLLGADDPEACGAKTFPLVAHNLDLPCKIPSYNPFQRPTHPTGWESTQAGEEPVVASPRGPEDHQD